MINVVCLICMTGALAILCHVYCVHQSSRPDFTTDLHDAQVHRVLRVLRDRRVDRRVDRRQTLGHRVRGDGGVVVAQEEVVGRDGSVLAASKVVEGHDDDVGRGRPAVVAAVEEGRQDRGEACGGGDLNRKPL